MEKLTVTTTTDLLAVAIHSLGFTPTSSVVLMMLTDSQLAATLRVDANPAMPATDWAAMITGYVHRVQEATAVVLFSFEDEQAMSPEQYRALDLLLTLARCPIRYAGLITEGSLTPYTAGDPSRIDTQKIPLATVQTCNAALELMLRSDTVGKLAADIPPYDPTGSVPIAEVEAFAQEADGLDAEEPHTRLMVCSRLIGMIMGYQCTGRINPEQGAWLAGMCTNKGLRDLLFASLATTKDDLPSIGAALMGEKAPEDWGFFTDGANALYTALEYVPPAFRTDLLAGLGWTRWIEGKGSEALNFLDLARELEPGHRLTGLLTRLVCSGLMPVSASTRH